MTTTARVCVFGSANMDLVVYADRAPRMGETVNGRRFMAGPGGKGANQAIAAARAGGRVQMSGAVGDDAYGRELLDTLDRAGVDTSAFTRVRQTTGTAHILVEAGGDNSIVVVPGANGTVTAPTPAQLAALDGAALLLLQLELPLEAVVAAAREAGRRGVRVVLTPAPAVPLPAQLLDCVDLLVPNEHELRVLTGAEDLDAAGKEVLRLVPEAVVTLGARGARWLRRGKEPVDVPGREVAVRDTTAAGDTFVGALAVRLGEGADMPQALEWANAAAALSVQRDGASTSMPTRAEIEAYATG